VRLGIVVSQSDATLVTLAARVGLADELGFDVAWVEERRDGVAGFDAPFVVAAALAPTTFAIRVVASVQAGPHPIYLAEESAVADQALNGRLVVALGHDDAALLAETADVLLAASAARPFRHEGERWRIPANLPANEVVEQRIRVTPTPAQLELPLWLTGSAAPGVAQARCLAHVAAAEEAPDDIAARWQTTVDTLGPAAARLRRPALRRVDADAAGAIDDDALVAALRHEQRLWGLDVAVLELPELEGDAYERALRAIASQVRPRVQLDELPYGLEDYWRRRRSDGTL
jgi:hypothetical protein